MWDFPETSHHLIARVKNLADAGAWTEFLGIYRPVVYRMARKRGMQDADAQDLTQRVFLSVFQAIDGWDPKPNGAPFRAWLVTVTRNAINTVLARSRPDVGAGASSMVAFLGALPADDLQTTEEFEIEGRREAVRWAAEQIRSEFSEATWRLFWQTSVQGLPVAEVAVANGCSSGAIYMARFHVLQRLKARVQAVSRHWELGNGKAES